MCVNKTYTSLYAACLCLLNYYQEAHRMELKATLQDYTQPEFLALVEKIWAVDVRKQDHDMLIAHFDRVSGHPKGADLIFYPGAEIDGLGHSAGTVVERVKRWQNSQGKAAYKDNVWPVVPVRPGDRLSVAERASKSSAKNLSAAQQLDHDVGMAGSAADQSLAQLESCVVQLYLPAVGVSAEGNRQNLSPLLKQVDALEEARFQVLKGIQKFNTFKMTVASALKGAQRDVSSSMLDAHIQSQVLSLATSTHDHYRARLTALEQRYSDLHLRAQDTLARAGEVIVRLREPFAVRTSAHELTFEASVSDANFRPCFLISGTPLSGESNLDRLDRAVRSTVAEFAWRITSSDEEYLGYLATILLFHFDNVGDEQHFGMSVPLSELVPVEGRNWASLAHAQATVYLPFRLHCATVASKPGRFAQGLRQIEELSQVYLMPINSSTMASVRVRSAVWDLQRQAFSFTSDGLMPRTVLWTLPKTLQSVQDTLIEGRDVRSRVSCRDVPSLPTLELHTEIAGVEFDDYVVVFPEGAGIDPLYVMFKDAREYAGVVTGLGQPVGEGWLSSALKDEGAAVPSPVADLLRGQVFKRFDLFTRAFWKAVAANPSLSNQFSALNQQHMQNGAAPFADEAGSKDQFLLLHRKTVAEGGSVYDVDNLLIDY